VNHSHAFVPAFSGEMEAFSGPQRLLAQGYRGRAGQVSELSTRRVRCSGELRVQSTVDARAGCQETFCIFALITSRRLSQSDLRERISGKRGKGAKHGLHDIGRRDIL
jgi:hypothetical protein